MNIIDTLITDRMGGCYNVSDLNRVEGAVTYLRDRFDTLPEELSAYLAGLGVAPDTAFEVPYSYPLGLTTKTNWTMLNIPAASAMRRYIDNVAALRDLLALPEAPELAKGMDGLTVEGANNIEKILQLVDAAGTALKELKENMADAAAKAWLYSGDLCAGEI